MLPVEQLRALRDHAAVVDAYDDALADARTRLAARFGGQLAARERAALECFPRANRAPSELASALGTKARMLGEAYAALRDGLERRAYMGAGACPAVEPNDSPARLIAWIGEQLGYRVFLDKQWRDTKDKAYREGRDDLAREAYQAAHARALAFAALAPDLVRLLPWRDDATGGLQEIRGVMLAVMSDAGGPLVPKPPDANAPRRRGQKLTSEQENLYRKVLKIVGRLNLPHRAVGNTQKVIEACAAKGITIEPKDWKRIRDWGALKKLV